MRLLTSFALHFHCGVFFSDWCVVTALSEDEYLHFASRFLIVREGWSIQNSSSAAFWLSNRFKPTSVGCCHARPTRDWILKSLTAMEINWRHLFTCMVAVGVPKLAVCQVDLSLQTWIRQKSGTGSSPQSLYYVTESQLRAFRASHTKSRESAWGFSLRLLSLRSPTKEGCHLVVLFPQKQNYSSSSL